MLNLLEKAKAKNLVMREKAIHLKIYQKMEFSIIMNLEHFGRDMIISERWGSS